MPSTFETCVKATMRVRSPMTDAAASRSIVPSSRTGMCRRTAPVRAASSCHGNEVGVVLGLGHDDLVAGGEGERALAGAPRPSVALPIA